MADDEGERIYPTVEDVYEIHDGIIEEDDDADHGVLQPGAVEYALDLIEHGHFGQRPETIHEKAAELMRHIASNHEFADGNKRTALSTASSFYLLNGYFFEYEDEEVRTLLKTFAAMERVVDMEAVVEEFEHWAVELDV